MGLEFADDLVQTNFLWLHISNNNSLRVQIFLGGHSTSCMWYLNSSHLRPCTLGPCIPCIFLTCSLGVVGSQWAYLGGLEQSSLRCMGIEANPKLCRVPLMDEMFHHLGALNYCNSWDFRDFGFCKTSSINSIAQSTGLSPDRS